MINGLDIFHAKASKGDGLRIIENKSGSGCYMTKNNTNNSKRNLKELQVLKF